MYFLDHVLVVGLGVLVVVVGLVVVNISPSNSVEDSSVISSTETLTISSVDASTFSTKLLISCVDTSIPSVDTSISSTKSLITSSRKLLTISSIDTSICFDDSSSNKRKDSDSIELSNKYFDDFFATFGIANPVITVKRMLVKIMSPAKNIVEDVKWNKVL